MDRSMAIGRTKYTTKIITKDVTKKLCGSQEIYYNAAKYDKNKGYVSGVEYDLKNIKDPIYYEVELTGQQIGSDILQFSF